MIAIVNIGPAPGNRRRGSARNQPKDPLGPHLYQIRINSTVVTTFTHTRGASLGDCLRQAAIAADKHHENHLQRLIRELHDA